MKLNNTLALAASVLAITLITPISMAQSNDESSEPVEDYSDDPSYQAARRLLEVFAGAADSRITDEERAEEEDELSSDPWPEPPKIDAWEHHYLIFQGENYFPVKDAYVTPYVTLFSLEYGYTPTGEENKNCGAEDEGKRNAAGITNEAIAAAETAVIGNAEGATKDGQRYGCPNTLGQLWGSGSQVMDKDHNPLAEQWFPDGTPAIVSSEIPLHDEHRYEGDDVVDFLVVASGGPDRLGDPAIHPLPVAKMIVAD